MSLIHPPKHYFMETIAIQYDVQIQLGRQFSLEVNHVGLIGDLHTPKGEELLLYLPLDLLRKFVSISSQTASADPIDMPLDSGLMLEANAVKDI